MSISGVGNRPPAPVTRNSDSTASMRRQRDGLQKRLEAIKSKPKNSRAEQDAAVAQKSALEKQIATINKRIQERSRQKGDSSSETSSISSNPQAITNQNSISNSLVDALRATEKGIQRPLSARDSGHLLDVLV